MGRSAIERKWLLRQSFDECSATKIVKNSTNKIVFIVEDTFPTDKMDSSLIGNDTLTVEYFSQYVFVLLCSWYLLLLLASSPLASLGVEMQ